MSIEQKLFSKKNLHKKKHLFKNISENHFVKKKNKQLLLNLRQWVRYEFQSFRKKTSRFLSLKFYFNFNCKSNITSFIILDINGRNISALFRQLTRFNLQIQNLMFNLGRHQWGEKYEINHLSEIETDYS